MIAKITKGRGFTGVIAYVSNKLGAELIGGNVSENPKRAAHEMGLLRQYSQCRSPVWHCSLSLSPGDRPLSNMEFRELAEKFLAKLGLDNNQYIIYRHTDRQHSHIHIIANRICLDEKHSTWNSWQDIKRARKAKTELEHEFNLIETPYNPQFARPEISRGQQEEARRKGVMPSKQYVAEAIASAIQRGNVRDFVQSLRVNGIEAIPNIANTGKMNGFSFRFGKKHYKGSQLKCSWASLKDRIGYDAEQDIEFLFSLVPEGKRPQKTEEIREHSPHRKRTIYTRAEWLYMGGERNSDYKRAYKMLDDGYSMKDTAQELRLQMPNISDRRLQKILLRAGQLWIDNNRNKLLWAHNSRRRYIRFSNDPAVMLIQVLGLLVGAAVRAVLQGIEEHQAIRRIDNLSQELQEMRDYAEQKAMQRLHRLEHQEREYERERENPLLAHALEVSIERPR